MVFITTCDAQSLCKSHMVMDVGGKGFFFKYFSNMQDPWVWHVNGNGDVSSRVFLVVLIDYNVEI